jgi:cytochrome P450
MTDTTRSRLPPGPRLPRWLQTLAFSFLPLRFAEACHRRYGDLVTFRFRDSRHVMVFDPDLVKQVFHSPLEQLQAGETNAVLAPIVGERSLLLLDGAEHLRARRLLLPPFHGEWMRAYESVMREAADRAIDSWPVGQPFALLPSMQSLTLDVIIRAVFGVDEGPRQSGLTRRVRAMIDPVPTGLGVLVMALSGGRRSIGAKQRDEKRRRLVDHLLDEEIAQRRAAGDLERREDILSMLLLARDEDGQAMTDYELRDQLVSLLVAGSHVTTATGLAWAFELLLGNPRVLKRLREELANGEGSYLDAVVKETLRVRPIVPRVGRVVHDQPFELGGHLIPPGTEINPSIAVIHRRADRYPDPSAFLPERFLGPEVPDTYTWLPFGGGTRRCPGASFAALEMRVVIRRVLERTHLTPVDRRPEKGARKGGALQRSINVPAGGVRVVQQWAPESGTALYRAEGVDPPPDRTSAPRSLVHATDAS